MEKEYSYVIHSDEVEHNEMNDTITICATLGGYKKGSESSVDIDWQYAMSRHTNFGDVVGFLHKHPGDNISMSARDMDTMDSWIKALGYPLFCVITANDKYIAYMCDIVNGDLAYLIFTDVHVRGKNITIKIKGEWRIAWTTAELEDTMAMD